MQIAYYPNKTTFAGTLTPNFCTEKARSSYDLVSHLGNVHMVISDRKVSVEDGFSGNVAYFVSDVISTNDVYPGGMLMPGRNFTSNSYRYGAFGYEKDDEVNGNGNNYTTEARPYDPRLIRFWF